MISVTLNKARLADLGACPAGLALFKGRPKITIKWTWRAYIWLERHLPGAAGWLADHGEIPRLHAPKADLRGVILRGAILRGAILRWSDLRGADLSGADLRGADLSRSDLRETDLSGADLSGAILRGADLLETDLHEADFEMAMGLRRAADSAHPLTHEPLPGQPSDVP